MGAPKRTIENMEDDDRNGVCDKFRDMFMFLVLFGVGELLRLLVLLV